MTRVNRPLASPAASAPRPLRRGANSCGCAGGGATLSLVSGGNNAVTSREAAVEILALNVFGIADKDGKPVTRRMTEQRIEELAEHPQGCGCGLCDLVPLTTVSKVYWTASRWQLSIARTRDRARR